MLLRIEDLVCRIYRHENSENVAMQAGCAMASGGEPLRITLILTYLTTPPLTLRLSRCPVYKNTSWYSPETTVPDGHHRKYRAIHREGTQRSPLVEGSIQPLAGPLIHPWFWKSTGHSRHGPFRVCNSLRAQGLRSPPTHAILFAPLPGMIAGWYARRDIVGTAIICERTIEGSRDFGRNNRPRCDLELRGQLSICTLRAKPPPNLRSKWLVLTDLYVSTWYFMDMRWAGIPRGFCPTYSRHLLGLLSLMNLVFDESAFPFLLPIETYENTTK